MLLFLLACTSPDGKSDDTAADTDTDADSDTDTDADSDTDTDSDTDADTDTDTDTDVDFVGDDPVEGGTLLAWGTDGLFVEESGSFRKITDVDATRPTLVDASQGTVTLVENCDVRVLDIATSTVLAEYSFACDSKVYVSDAVYRDGALWVARTNYAPALLVDGSETDLALYVDDFVWDQDDLFGVADYDREGTTITPIDASGIATAPAWWRGFHAQPRGGSVASYAGEYGNSDYGTFSLELWNDPSSDLGRDLPDGMFADDMDAVYGRASLVRIYDGGPGSGVLLGPYGAIVDTFDACFSPRLVWYADRLEGWCTEPLRRYTWTWDGSTWVRASEESFTEDVSHLILLEEGD